MTELFILLVLLILSGVFSGSETALVDLSIGRVEALVKEGRGGARALHQLKRDPSRMLTTILIGNNLVNIAASVMATVLATRLFGSAGPGVAVGVLTIMILVFGEITPKSLATRYSERISLTIAPPLLAFMRLIYPLVWLFGKFTTWVHKQTGATSDPTITESELISMLGHGEREGTIDHGEREIIERVFEFHDLKVRDVMTPHDEVFSLDGSKTVAEALPLVAVGSYTRIPLHDENRNNLYKILYLRDLLNAVADGQTNARLDEYAHDPLFVPQYQAIDELFSKLLRNKRHLAIVVDEHGMIRGIVTLEDLLEELVGEIFDESDVAQTMATRVSEHELAVDGSTELRVVEDFFDLDLPGKPTDTVSLWILTRTESIPKKDSVFTIDGLEVKISEASPRRIDRVTIRRRQPDASEDPETESPGRIGRDARLPNPQRS
ncbi:MAG: hemolysin family protein [Alphaproteobacteria bacterium]|nr:hemolysin family protein [Alphaproteobacteria bacterium]